MEEKKVKKIWRIETKKYDILKPKQTCCECKMDFSQNQPRLIHDFYHYSCGRVLCLHCCLLKVQQARKTKKSIGLLCSPKTDSQFPQTLAEMLQSVCIICGTNKCSLSRVKLINENTQFYISMDCYQELPSRSFWQFCFDKKISALIDKCLKPKCNVCKNKQINIIELFKQVQDKTKSQSQIFKLQKKIELRMCDECWKRNNLEQNFCSVCDQIEIIQNVGKWYLGSSVKKQFAVNLIYKNWPFGLSKLKIFKCSYCIYDDYLMMEAQNSRIKMKTQDFLTFKIAFQEYFSNHCMVCSASPEILSQNYPLSSNYDMGICSFMCKRCYSGHSQKNVVSNGQKQLIKYKCSKKAKQFLVKTRQTCLHKSDSIVRLTYQSRCQEMLSIYRKMLEKQTTINGVSSFELCDPQQESKLINNSNLSMINHKDMSSESYKSQIDHSQYDDPSLNNVLQSFQSKKSQSQIYEVDEQTQEQFRKTKNHKVTFSNSPNPLIEDFALDDFNSTSKHKKLDVVRKFDLSSWEKSVIHEFKKILESEKIEYVDPQKPNKLSSEEKWQLKSIISSDPNPKKRCLMYKECYTEQQCLKIEKLCDLCFVKYLLGDEKIVKSVENQVVPEVKSYSNDFRPRNQEINVMGNGKGGRSYFENPFM